MVYAQAYTDVQNSHPRIMHAHAQTTQTVAGSYIKWKNYALISRAKSSFYLGPKQSDPRNSQFGHETPRRHSRRSIRVCGRP